MAQVVVRWEEGGPCCLICLGDLVHQKVGGGAAGAWRNGARNAMDMFLKVCHILGVGFSEIQQEWHFGASGNDKLPFCVTCLEAIQAVIGLQEQLDALQKKIVGSTESIRQIIRQSSVNNFGTPSTSGADLLRVQHFRSRALAFSGHPPQGSTPIQPVTGSGSPWPPNPQNIYLSTESTSAQSQRNYISPPPPPPSATAILQSATASFTPSTPSSQDNYFYDNGDARDDDDNGGNYSEEGNNDDPIPPKRPRKSTGSKQAVQSTSTPKSSQKRDGGARRNEHFSPIITDPTTGRMTFEGILITPNPSGGYTCGLCSSTIGKSHNSVSLRKIKIHIKGFHLHAYTCHLCSKNFTSNDILNQHITRSHTIGDRPCPICAKPIRPRYLLLHTYTHMNSSEKAALIASGFKPPVSSFEKIPRFPCPQCGAMFKKMTNLRIHERTHMPITSRPMCPCPHCPKTYTNTQSLKEHLHRVHSNGLPVRADVRKREICRICGKSVFARVLARHLKTHVATENRPYACGVCGKRFQEEKVLRRHEEKFHKEGETKEGLPFECDICGKRSGTRAQVRAHRRRVHRNNWRARIPSSLAGEVTVDDPGEDFMELEDLNREGLQHVGGNVFSYHLYQVEKMEGGGGWRCKTCGRILEGEGEVEEHVRLEHIGNFRCNLCTKRMKNLAEVVAHKRVEHLNMDSFNCPVCKRPGITRKAVKEHLISHKGIWEVAEGINRGQWMCGGEKRMEEREEILRGMGERIWFECGECGEGFGGLGGLQEHWRREHPDKKGKEGEGMGRKRGRRRKYVEGRCRCEECGKEFEKGASLARHVSRVHSGQREETRGRRRRKVEGIEEDKDLPDTVVKIEVASEDDTEEEGESGDGGGDWAGESDPEFKAGSKINVTTAQRRVSLRATRSRGMVNYLEAEDPEGGDGGDLEENEDNILISEKDIKQSPQSSDAEGGDQDN